MSAKSFVVITQHVVGSSGQWSTVYRSDGKTFADRTKAISHGWRVLDHDDFNIGTLVAGQLVAFGWGDKDFGTDEDGAPHGGYDLHDIQDQALTGGA